MASDGFLVCSIYDLGAKEACPPFVVKNESLLWREIANFMSKTPVGGSEFVVAILGRWDSERLAGLDLAVPEYFSVDREPLSEESVKRRWAAGE